MNPMNQNAAQPTQQVNPGAMPASAEAPQKEQADPRLIELLVDRITKLTDDDAPFLEMALADSAVVDIFEKLMPELAIAFEIVDQNSPDEPEEMPIRTGMAGQGMAGAQGANPLLENTASRGLMAG